MSPPPSLSAVIRSSSAAGIPPARRAACRPACTAASDARSTSSGSARPRPGIPCCAASTPWSTRSASCASAARKPTSACTITRRRRSRPPARAARSAWSTSPPLACTRARSAAFSLPSWRASARSPPAVPTTASCGRRCSTAKGATAPCGSGASRAGRCTSCPPMRAAGSTPSTSANSARLSRRCARSATLAAGTKSSSAAARPAASAITWPRCDPRRCALRRASRFRPGSHASPATSSTWFISPRSRSAISSSCGATTCHIRTGCRTCSGASLPASDPRRGFWRPPGPGCRPPTAGAPWLLSPLIGLFAYRITIVMHDCIHRSLFRSARLSARVGTLLGCVTGIDFASFSRQHLLHHRLYGRPGDPQGFHYLGLKGATLATYAWHLLRPLLGFNLRYALAESILRPCNLAAAARTGEIFALAAIQLAILVIVTGGGAHLWLAALPFASAATFGLFFSQLRGIAEHAAGGAEAEAANVRSHAPHWLDRVLLYDLNFNYHKEHHLYPHYSSRDLAALHGRLAELPPLEPSMFRTLKALSPHRA